MSATSTQLHEIDYTTHRITLIFDIRGRGRKLAPKATNVVAVVFLVIDSEYNFSQTTRVVSWFVVLQRTNIEAIAQ
jgi:hypothetical protein